MRCPLLLSLAALVLGGGFQGLLEAGESLLDQALPGENLTLLQVFLVLHHPRLNQIERGESVYNLAGTDKGRSL